MSKQTAVEWYEKEINFLIERYEEKEISKREFITMKHNLFYDAKEMEKEQMWDYIKKIYCIGHKSLEFHRLEFEQYYNETYKKEEK
jgi:predicted transcriptional regulator